MECKECPERAKCLRYLKKGSSAAIGCDYEEWECAEGLGPEDAGPAQCERCGEDGCPYRCAEQLFPDPESDVEDEHGNRGGRIYEVQMSFTRTQTATKTYSVAASSEDEAAERAEKLAQGEAEFIRGLDWEDDDDSFDWTIDDVEPEL